MHVFTIETTSVYRDAVDAMRCISAGADYPDPRVSIFQTSPSIASRPIDSQIGRDSNTFKVYRSSPNITFAKDGSQADYVV